MTTGRRPTVAWHAARAPTAWRRHVATAMAPCVDVDRAGDEVDTLARQRPVVCPEPTWGELVDDLVAGTASDEVAPRPRPRPRPARTRPTTWATTPTPAGDPAASRPAATGGIGDHVQPPGTGRPTGQATPTAAVTGLPRAVDHAVLLRTVGSRPSASPTSPGQGTRPRGTAGAWAPGSTGHVMLPAPAGAATTWIDHAVQRLAKRLGTDPATCADALAGTVVRPGPAVDLPALRHLAGAATTGALRPDTGTGTGSAPDRGNHAVRPRPRAQPTGRGAGHDRDDASQARSSARRAGSHDRPPDTSTAPGSPPTPEVDTADPGRGARYAELPTRDDRPPRPEPRDTASPADAPPWSTGDRRSGPAHDDLEARITQLLDEAARRHGIEV